MWNFNPDILIIYCPSLSLKPGFDWFSKFFHFLCQLGLLRPTCPHLSWSLPCTLPWFISSALSGLRWCKAGEHVDVLESKVISHTYSIFIMSIIYHPKFLEITLRRLPVYGDISLVSSQPWYEAHRWLPLVKKNLGLCFSTSIAPWNPWCLHPMPRVWFICSGMWPGHGKVQKFPSWL